MGEKKYIGDQSKRAVIGDSNTMKRMMDDAVRCHRPPRQRLLAESFTVASGDSGTARQPASAELAEPRLPPVQVINVMLEDDSPFVEDVGLSNLKLVIGFGSVAASVVSHIYPAPFPKNWWVLLACCAWYFIGSGILQLLLSFVELESIVLLRYKDAERRGKRASGINVTSHFPRYQHVYTLGITPLPSGSLALFSAPKFKPNPTREGRELPQADYAQIHWSGEPRSRPAAPQPCAARRREDRAGRWVWPPRPAGFQHRLKPVAPPHVPCCNRAPLPPCGSRRVFRRGGRLLRGQVHGHDPSVPGPLRERKQAYRRTGAQEIQVTRAGVQKRRRTFAS